MAFGVRNDPYRSFSFLVECKGMITGGFSEVHGLYAETETEDYYEGGVNDFAYKIIKSTRYPNLSLRRGMADSDELWRWYSKVVSGEVDKRGIYVILVDDDGKEKCHWYFKEAFPVKWIGPEFRAASNMVAVETIEFTHKGFDFKRASSHGG